MHMFHDALVSFAERRVICMTIDNPFFDKMCKNYYEIVDEGLHNIIFKRAALSEAGIIGAAICAEGEMKNGN